MWFLNCILCVLSDLSYLILFELDAIPDPVILRIMLAIALVASLECAGVKVPLRPASMRAAFSSYLSKPS